MPTITTTVTRIAYPAAATGDPATWYIIITPQGACKGDIEFRPREGDRLIMDGEWTTYQGNRQFAFRSARLDIPTQPRDQLAYVCARAHGLGPAMEALIWDAAGEGWQDITEGQVPRLRGALYEAYRDAITAMQDDLVKARVVAALEARGCTIKMAERAWVRWGEDATSVAESDCYRLAELDGYGYRDVDGKVRAAYGVGDDDPRRIRAAVLYALRRLTDAGDTVMEWAAVYREAVAACGSAQAGLVTDCAGELIEAGEVVACGDGGELMALAGDWRDERDVWEWVVSAEVVI